MASLFGEKQRGEREIVWEWNRERERNEKKGEKEERLFKGIMRATNELFYCDSAFSIM